MNRIGFLTGYPKSCQVPHSEFRNKYSFEYVSILDIDGNRICDYILLTYIEKTGYSDETERPWDLNREWEATYTRCTKCYNLVEEAEIYSYGDCTLIKVDNSIDMLPLYMKWALKFKGIKFNAEGYFDGTVDEWNKSRDTLNGLYQNINGKTRLANFTECRCTKCGKEWIVF